MTAQPVPGRGELLIATGSSHKLLELSEMLDLPHTRLLSLRDLSLDDSADETGSTFEDNAVIKAMHYARLSGMPTLADDSGPRKGTRHIKGGRRPVRNALYMAAFNAMRFCDRFRRVAEQMRSRGKKFKVTGTGGAKKAVAFLRSGAQRKSKASG